MRLTHSSRSCIDLLITDSPGFILQNVVAPIGNSDHSTLLAELNSSNTSNEVEEKNSWQYHLCDLAELNNEISNTDWDPILNNQDSDNMVGLFTLKLQDIIKHHIPFKLNKIKSNDQPWFNEFIKREINKRNQSYKNFMKTQNPYFFFAYKNQNAIIHNLVRDAKLDHQQKLINKLDSGCKQNKNYWDLIKKFIGKKFTPDIPTLVDPENYSILSRNFEKANLFLKIFSNKNHIESVSINLPDFPSRCNITMTKKYTNSAELMKMINELDVNKACGSDGINNRMLKDISNSIAPLLATMFNKLISNKSFPEIWKTSTVVPIHKKDCRRDPNNYRPISLLNSISKLYEKIIFNSIFSHVSQYNLIYENQSGFLPGHSTVDQLLAITSLIFDNFNKNLDVRAIFLDIAAAFDTVPHHLLIHKLASYGIDGDTLLTIKNYLSNRRIKIKINGVFSNLSDENFINSGVPQGSILGPLLFLLYINDLPDNLTSKTYLYADDTSIYMPIDPTNPHDSLSILQNDLNKIFEWSKRWGLIFKPSKSVDVTFTKSGTTNYPNMHLSNDIIPKKLTHKHLGFILDSNLNFNSHVENLADKVQKLLNPLKFLSKFLKSHHLETIYTSFIKPHFEYCDIIYNSANKTYLDKLERKHYQAALLVSGCPQVQHTKSFGKLKLAITLSP